MGYDWILGVINDDIDKLNDGYDPKDGKDGNPEDWANFRFCLERIVEARDGWFPSVGKRDVPYHRTDTHFLKPNPANPFLLGWLHETEGPRSDRTR